MKKLFFCDDVKNCIFACITFIMASLVLPLVSYATSTVPYLDVTYTHTVQIPVTVTQDIQSPSNMFDTWNNIRSNSYGEFRNDPSDVLSSQAFNTTNRFIFTRPFFTFDTSVIPDDATVASSSLNLYVESANDLVNTADSYFAVLQGSPASSTSFSINDYNDCGSLDGATLGSSEYDTTFIPSGGYYGFALNSTGRSWVSKTGYTTLCMRDGHDIENASYTSNNTWKYNSLNYTGN